jgi:Kef-type K+ transport system membrane component KefB
MMSRGEVGLIVATVGLDQGLINDSTFAAIVGVVIVTTLLTPPFLRFLFSKDRERPAKQQDTAFQGDEP